MEKKRGGRERGRGREGGRGRGGGEEGEAERGRESGRAGGEHLAPQGGDARVDCGGDALYLPQRRVELPHAAGQTVLVWPAASHDPYTLEAHTVEASLCLVRGDSFSSHDS